MKAAKHLNLGAFGGTGIQGLPCPSLQDPIKTLCSQGAWAGLYGPCLDTAVSKRALKASQVETRVMTGVAL